MTTVSPSRTAERAAHLAPTPDLSIDELDVAICRLARQMNEQTYRFLLLVRDFDDRYGWAKWSLRNCAEWLAWRCGMTMSTAREKLRTAHALRELPVISAAFADGRLSYSKVRALTRAAKALNEDLLLAYALDATASQVEERCRQLRNVSPEATAAARSAWERRSLSVSRNAVRGTVTIMVELPAEDGEIVANALDSAVAGGEVATGIEFASDRELAGNGWGAQQADALVAIAKAYLGGQAAAPGTARGTASAASSCADHYQVVVHVDEKSLRGGMGRSDLPIETIRRLGCDGSLITVVEDERGTPLDVGRKQRTVSTPLKRALWSRDRGCTFPGCANKRFVDAHHVRHWAEGGDTSLENLTLLCTHHHRLLHEGGFKIRRDQTGAIFYQRPDGRVIPRGGYRAEDMLDDGAGDNGAENGRASECKGAAGENPSAEGWISPFEHPANPPAEVRELRAVYWIDRARPVSSPMSC